MSEAFALIEVMGLSSAIVVADIMLKTALVDIRGIKVRHGSGQAAITLAGDTASVQAAYAAGVEAAKEMKVLFAHHMIAAPDSSINKLIELSRVGQTKKKKK